MGFVCFFPSDHNILFPYDLFFPSLSHRFIHKQTNTTFIFITPLSSKCLEGVCLSPHTLKAVSAFLHILKHIVPFLSKCFLHSSHILLSLFSIFLNMWVFVFFFHFFFFLLDGSAFFHILKHIFFPFYFLTCGVCFSPNFFICQILPSPFYSTF